MKLPALTKETLKDIVGEGLISLKGKDYLQVAHRIVAARYNNPAVTIATEPFALEVGEGKRHFMRCVVSLDNKVLAVAHKEIKFDTNRKGPAGDWPLEMAETGAIGRALGLCGFGTLSGDLDESDELADAPLLTGR